MLDRERGRVRRREPAVALPVGAVGGRPADELTPSGAVELEEGARDVVPLGRHGLSSAVASASETSTIASPCSAAMRPKFPSWTRSAAFSRSG